MYIQEKTYHKDIHLLFSKAGGELLHKTDLLFSLFPKVLNGFILLGIEIMESKCKTIIWKKRKERKGKIFFCLQI